MKSIPKPKSKEWHERRRNHIGGSDANIIMSGDPVQILNLWEIKTGRRVPEDLSDNFPVALGQITEDLNCDWYEKVTGNAVVSRGHFIVAKSPSFMSATLDGEVLDGEGNSMVYEAKHINGFISKADAIAKYQPQLHHNMMVMGVKKAVLGVIFGNVWDHFEIEASEEYASELLKREEDFWECVKTQMPPTEIKDALKPPPATKIVKMHGPDWEGAALVWKSYKDGAKAFASAEKRIKALVPADAKLATGSGISVSRSKSGALKITQEGDAE